MGYGEYTEFLLAAQGSGGVSSLCLFEIRPSLPHSLAGEYQQEHESLGGRTGRMARRLCVSTNTVRSETQKHPPQVSHTHIGRDSFALV